MNPTIRVTIIFGNSHTPPFGSIVHICDSLDEAHLCVWRTVRGAGASGAVNVTMATLTECGYVGWRSEFATSDDIVPPVIRVYWRVRCDQKSLAFDWGHLAFATAKRTRDVWRACGYANVRLTRISVRAKRKGGAR